MKTRACWGKKSASRIQLHHECLHNLICPCMMLVSLYYVKTCAGWDAGVHKNKQIRVSVPQTVSRGGKNLIVIADELIYFQDGALFIPMKVDLTLLITVTSCWVAVKIIYLYGYSRVFHFYYTKWRKVIYGCLCASWISFGQWSTSSDWPLSQNSFTISTVLGDMGKTHKNPNTNIKDFSFFIHPWPWNVLP